LTSIGIGSNLAVSLINILYNLEDIVDKYLEGSRKVFEGQLATVNGVLYSLGVAVCVALVWSVIRGVAQIEAGKRIEPAALAALRRRALRVGLRIAGVSFVLWVASGVVFPLRLPRMLVEPGSLDALCCRRCCVV
jgi:hypothetical protein